MNKMSNTTLKTLRFMEFTSNFLEITNETLKKLRGEILIPRTNYRYVIRPFINSFSISEGTTDLIQIKKVNVRKKVLGIDSTCMPLAESRNGLVLAVKACLISKNFDNYVFTRIGPLIAYLDGETVRWFKRIFAIPEKILRLAPVETRYAKKLLISTIEYTLITEAINLSKNSLILLDGSLREPEIQLKSKPFKKLIRESLRKENTLIGISKRSNLFKWCLNEFSRLAQSDPPTATHVPNASKYIKGLWGEVYFTIFEKNGVPLRVDILSLDTSCNILNYLYSNDSFRNGYPEILRKAHVYSKILPSEKIGLALQFSKYESKIVRCEMERDALFGAFNKTAGEWMKNETFK